MDHLGLVSRALYGTDSRPMDPLLQVECGVYGDLIIIYPKPFSIYLRGTIDACPGPTWPNMIFWLLGETAT